mgnify:CR=1 FL=1
MDASRSNPSWQGATSSPTRKGSAPQPLPSSLGVTRNGQVHGRVAHTPPGDGLSVATAIAPPLERRLPLDAIRSRLPSQLTRREREVASLIGEGLTSRQIAERLVVSLRTVEMHLTNAYRKLGIASRLAKAHLGAAVAPHEMPAVQQPLAATIKSAPTDLARAPNALANALASLQENKSDPARADKNGWVTTVEVAERS